MRVVFLILSTVGAYTVAVWQLYKVTRRLVRYFDELRKAASSSNHKSTSNKKSTPETPRLFSALIFIGAIALAVMLLLVVGQLQNSPSSRTFALIADGLAAFLVLAALILAIGAPAYTHVQQVKQGNERLEEKVTALEERVRVLSGLLEEQYPIQGSLPFNEDTVSDKSM